MLNGWKTAKQIILKVKEFILSKNQFKNRQGWEVGSRFTLVSLVIYLRFFTHTYTFQGKILLHYIHLTSLEIEILHSTTPFIFFTPVFTISTFTLDD